MTHPLVEGGETGLLGMDEVVHFASCGGGSGGRGKATLATAIVITTATALATAIAHIVVHLCVEGL